MIQKQQEYYVSIETHSTSVKQTTIELTFCIIKVFVNCFLFLTKFQYWSFLFLPQIAYKQQVSYKQTCNLCPLLLSE